MVRAVTFIAALVVGLIPAAPSMGAILDAPPLPIVGAFAGAPPQVSAQSWLLFDDTFGQALAEHDADIPRAMASTTKIMTALVALDQNDLDMPITVTAAAVDVGEAEAGLMEGEQLTLRQLLAAMLVRSANDAAEAIAEGVAGSVDAFVGLMNNKVRELGLEDTHFQNPHGLDEPGHYTTARDLLTMTRVAMSNPVFSTLVKTQTARLPDTPDGSQRILHTTNELLGSYPGAIGVKTGYTGEAGHVLVAAAERDGRRLYAVVMGSTDAFGDAAALLDYGFAEFGVIQVIMEGVTYAQRRVAADTQQMAASSTVETFTSKQETVTLRTGFSDAIPTVSATVGDEAVGTAELVGPEAPALPTLKDALTWVGRYWAWLWGR
jgi:D-alanyl-D-alanine carboxypeptidase (penicillin-binding protein 5/6)